MDSVVEVKAREKLTEKELQDIGALLHKTFGQFAQHYEWAEQDWHILVSVDGELVSHAQIIERTGSVNGRAVTLGGIGGVVTLRDWRGKGLGSIAMKEAANFMRDQLGVEFGLLSCGGEGIRNNFYAKLGWQEVEDPMVFEQSTGQKSFDKHIKTMVLPCCATYDWPKGKIDLCGLPF